MGLTRLDHYRFRCKNYDDDVDKHLKINKHKLTKWATNPITIKKIKISIEKCNNIIKNLICRASDDQVKKKFDI